MLTALIFKLLPYPRRFSFLGSGMVWLWYDVYESFQEKAIEYHKRELGKLDVGFSFSEATSTLMQERAVLRSYGMRSSDPRYPSIELPPSRKGTFK